MTSNNPPKSTPPKVTIESLLNDIYEDGYNAGDFGGSHTPPKQRQIKEALDRINTIMDEVIGPDEDVTQLKFGAEMRAVARTNILRAEQRKRLEKLGGL